MKDHGWRLVYSPFHVLVVITMAALVVAWLPAIIWFFLADTIDEMANVGP